MSAGSKLPLVRILRTDPLPLSSEMTPTMKAIRAPESTGSRMVVLTQEQHERVWEIVAQCLPQKVADDPELHEAAARIASAIELGPRQDLRPVRWMLRMVAGVAVWVIFLFTKEKAQ
jgi:hypothetical protein